MYPKDVFYHGRTGLESYTGVANAELGERRDPASLWEIIK